jgi:hypothetical protein
LAVCSSDCLASLFRLASTLGVLDAQKTLVLALAVRSEDRRCSDVAMHRSTPRSLEALRPAPYTPSFPRSCASLCRRAAHHRYRSTGSTDISFLSCSEERLASKSRARERGVLAEASSPRMIIAERRHRSPVGRPWLSEECRGAIRNRRFPKESCAVECSLRHRSAEFYQLPKKPLAGAVHRSERRSIRRGSRQVHETRTLVRYPIALPLRGPKALLRHRPLHCRGKPRQFEGE